VTSPGNDEDDTTDAEPTTTAKASADAVEVKAEPKWLDTIVGSGGPAKSDES
jgi:hypothetical protein